MENNGGGGGESSSTWQATPPPPKRKRTSKATNSQFEELIRQLEARPFLASRRFTGLQGKENFDVGWREVAKELNRIHNGAVKSAEQWITVWRDFKSRCTAKAAKLNRQRVETGNRDISAPPLSELEKRVVSLVGVDYTLGTSCPDAMPEEDTAQRDLEAGGVFETDTYEINITQTGPNALAQNYVIEESGHDLEAGVTLDSVNFISHSGLNQPTGIETGFHQPLASAEGSISQPSTSQQALQITTNPRETEQNRQRRNRGLNPRSSVAEQHNTARSDFLAVAESNACAMKVLAEAMKMQAEAAKMQAEAAKIQAEAAKTHAAAMMLLGEAANKLCHILENKK